MLTFIDRTSMRRVWDLESRQDESQNSLTLDPRVIMKVDDERSGVPAGTYATSLISSNNFINFCATVNLPLTNGTQVEGGSCNAAPIGVLASTDHIPFLKFQFPLNRATLMRNVPFTIQFTVHNLIIGTAINAEVNYLAAPQQTDLDGSILGHSAVVIEKLESLDDTTPTDPQVFKFFLGTHVQDSNGLNAMNVTTGLAEGFYRISSITTNANLQPITVPLLQHGAIDDAVYFTVVADAFSSRTVKRETDVKPVFSRQNANTNTSNFGDDVQNSTTLLSSQVATGFATDGLQGQPNSGQPASLTSSNNFINYCLTVNKALANGQQSNDDSCNPIPMGAIPSKIRMPSFKFVFPKNFGVLPPNEAFTIKLNFTNMDIEMTDPEVRYLSAPQQLTSNGLIKGYARVVIEALTSFNQTSVTDPLKVAFAASMNHRDGDRVLTAEAPKGLPAGFYRLSSRALTANHAPIGLPVSQRGATNDVVYFQVGDGGSGSTTANSISATPPASTTPMMSVRALPHGKRNTGNLCK
ncbi:hypothetical protein PQX77_007497 [Marasmius sp. AFHP31]|nr:hypothetical protein PQX77_007497 [Marasmius sp. AFHP31]